MKSYTLLVRLESYVSISYVTGASLKSAKLGIDKVFASVYGLHYFSFG